MKRWTIRVIGVTSLLLLAGTVWMWVRSFWFDDQVQWTRVETISIDGERSNSNTLLWIGSSRGRVGLRARTVIRINRIASSDVQDDRPVIQWWWSEDDTNFKSIEQNWPNWNRLLGVGFGSFKASASAGIGGPFSISARCVILPWGYVAVIFIIAPLLWGYLAMREKRKVERSIRGLCVHCGYDLRGAGGVCPECGNGKAGVVST